LKGQDTARAFEWFDRATALPRETFPSMYWSIQFAYLGGGQIEKAVNVYRRFLIGNGGGGFRNYS